MPPLRPIRSIPKSPLTPSTAPCPNPPVVETTPLGRPKLKPPAKLKRPPPPPPPPFIPPTVKARTTQINPDCISCGGTGISSSGSLCHPCSMKRRIN